MSGCSNRRMGLPLANAAPRGRPRPHWGSTKPDDRGPSQLGAGWRRGRSPRCTGQNRRAHRRSGSHPGRGPQLLASEVITNAILHGGGRRFVTIDRTPERVRVEVTDDSVQQPELRYGGPLDEGGRGLPSAREALLALGRRQPPRQRQDRLVRARRLTGGPGLGVPEDLEVVKVHGEGVAGSTACSASHTGGPWLGVASS